MMPDPRILHNIRTSRGIPIFMKAYRMLETTKPEHREVTLAWLLQAEKWLRKNSTGSMYQDFKDLRKRYINENWENENVGTYSSESKERDSGGQLTLGFEED